MVEQNLNLWLQQDGATAHAARPTMNLLREIFGERLISKNSDSSWPPHSPDLIGPDFFLCGYLTEKVTIRQLKQNIRDEILSL
ncbi:uncharacterized protein TNCV_2681411 [Trichonephila clavipes]|uniref:Transposase n=1 Tax=Trichonephila clavipes TaxID=2585209 RepID=A0A8X6VFW0_TRICX|nr:uncharacterized protein TNCV_2681411 [Trichonephila clavipes]